MAAAAGIVAWKAVSKQATAGTSTKMLLTSSSPWSDFGWCSGARSVSSSSRRRTSASTSTGAVNSLPPWTTRWPTASIGPFLETKSLAASSSTRPEGRVEILRRDQSVVLVEHGQLQAARTGVDDEDPHYPGTQ